MRLSYTLTLVLNAHNYTEAAFASVVAFFIALKLAS